MVKLKPCPFCGSPAVRKSAYLEDDGKETDFYIQCSNVKCSATGMPGWGTMGHETKAAATRYWNRRAKEANNAKK